MAVQNAAPWTPFGNYDPTQQDLVLVFDPFPAEAQMKAVYEAPAPPSLGSVVVTVQEDLPKPIEQWESATFALPVGAKSWSPTAPCVSGVPRQSGDTPGKRWLEKRQRKRALKAHKDSRAAGALEHSMKGSDPFQVLSDHIMQCICSNLDVSEILRLSLLNRQWARVGRSGSLWQQMYNHNMSNQQRYGMLHFGFDRTQVWLEEPAAKHWRRIYLSKVRDLASALRTKSGRWKAFEKTEVFVDVIEKLRVHIAVSGRVLNAEITGTVIAECHLPDLSAQSELKLNLIDSPSVPRVVLDDVTFHNCVDVANFASAVAPRVLFRAPTAAPFEVMRYRVLAQKLRVPFHVEAIYMKDLDKHSYELSVTIKSNFKESTKALIDVIVHVPVPPGSYVKTVTKVSGGEAEYHTRGNSIRWRYSNKPLTLMSTVTIPKGEALDWERPPLELECQPFLYNVSGFRCLGFVLPDSRDIKPHSWVRYTTVVASFKHDV